MYIHQTTHKHVNKYTNTHTHTQIYIYIYITPLHIFQMLEHNSVFTYIQIWDLDAQSKRVKEPAKEEFITKHKSPPK